MDPGPNYWRCYNTLGAILERGTMSESCADYFFHQDTNNQANNLDLVVPCNNKGKKSLGLFFYILMREYLKSMGKIKSDDLIIIFISVTYYFFG